MDCRRRPKMNPCEKYIYSYVKLKTKDLDTVYEDYIIQLVGELGLNILKYHDLVESCGVINGRQLYVLKK